MMARIRGYAIVLGVRGRMAPGVGRAPVLRYRRRREGHHHPELLMFPVEAKLASDDPLAAVKMAQCG